MSTDQQRVRALDKIRKLLNLAQDGRGNPTEAETALRQAQALMAKYSVDESEAILKELNSDADAIIEMWRRGGVNAAKSHVIAKVFPGWCGVLSFGVGRLFDCRTVIRTDPQGAKSVVFGGYRVDAQVAAWTYDYLLTCTVRASAEFDRRLKAGDYEWVAREYELSPSQVLQLTTEHSKGRKNDFRHAMAATLQRRMLKMKAERDQHLATHPTEGALVVSKLAAIARRFGDPRKDKKSHHQSGVAGYAGQVAGQRANLNPNPLQHSPGPGGLNLLR